MAHSEFRDEEFHESQVLRTSNGGPNIYGDEELAW
jgi:hypothetical protein